MNVEYWRLLLWYTAGQSGPDSKAHCTPWAKGEGLLRLACMEERESVDKPGRVDLSILSLSYSKQGE